MKKSKLYAYLFFAGLCLSFSTITAVEYDQEAQQSYKKIGESNNDESNPNINDENKIPKDKDVDGSNIDPALSPNKADKDSGNVMLRNVDLF